jgi:hypothetical protein
MSTGFGSFVVYVLMVPLSRIFLASVLGHISIFSLPSPRERISDMKVVVNILIKVYSYSRLHSESVMTSQRTGSWASVSSRKGLDVCVGDEGRFERRRGRREPKVKQEWTPLPVIIRP